MRQGGEVGRGDDRGGRRVRARVGLRLILGLGVSGALAGLTGCHHNTATVYAPPAASAPTVSRTVRPAEPMVVPMEIPAESRLVATEVGLASWYGQAYVNRRSADGTVYDGQSLTAASRRMLTNFPVHAKAPAAAAVLPESLVQGYFRYVAGVRNPLELVRLWWSLVQWRPQVLVYLGAARGVRSARRDAWFFRCCGIWRQIGVPHCEEMQANLPQANGLEPECERLARNLSELGDARVEDRASWSLSLTCFERARAAEAMTAAGGRPVLAVSVGTKVQSKDWGRERWRTLLRAVGEAYPEYVLALLECGKRLR